ncbi:carboxylesterase/lipase family protein [Streptomyces violaceusniger]|uniref:Carboxylic ester hydrolase n=1 Tax=Streptomyces violaceusniger (strain Tu 4113) TaxID=653045 RepID=G2NZ36_STRV4|nr:carboxylesterase family protein [Streptomyces violaceusniger]AEM82930.1 Carboxylesterase type B [Streptomyces violaceusniger Tu 4113]
MTKTFAPIVATSQGAVRGRQEEHATVFRHIPYAAPPRGAARFAPPTPHPPWDGVRDATAAGPTAPQPKRDAFGDLDMSPYFGQGWVPGEDYLAVNVWTPDTTRDDLPVMVFVHGGGFVAGSTRSALYDGTGFARDGVVLVTLNYRLGVPGFLHLPDAPDNRGLLDVIAALRWVEENIAAFGGDRSRVTLFGQSAGATIVGAVVADPRAGGLFQRAIIQSGNGLGAFAPAQADRVTRALARILGTAPTAEALASVPDERFVQAMPRLAGIDLTVDGHFDPLIGLSPFSLVLDQQPAEAVAAGCGAGVDLLLGTNAEEGNLYLAPLGHLASSTEEDVHAVAARSHPAPQELVEVYRRERPGASAGELRSAIMTDALFGAGTRRLAAAHAQHPSARTHVYEFAWRSRALDGRLGATHVMELPFVFDRTGLPRLHGPEAILGPAEPPAGLASRLHATWIRFARTGDPGWPPYESVRRTTMRIAEAWTQVADPGAPIRRAWE